MNSILRFAALLLIATLLGGCAALNRVHSEVTTYSDWPADRKPGRYAFERLPSQKANATRQAELEAAASGALEKAGFTVVPDAAQADVIVQIGARLTRVEVSPWDDPGPAADLMRRLRAAYDPRQTLNPGRFLADS